MQNENQTAGASPPLHLEEEKRSKPYEIILLFFGFAGVASLLIGNAVLLLITAGFFLILALVAIARGIPLRGESPTERLYTDANGATHKAKRPWTPLRIVGLTLLIIILLPVVAYAGLFLLLTIMFMASGGRGS